MAQDAVSRLAAHARRVGEIASVLGKYGLADSLRWLDVDFVQDRLRAKDGSRLRDQPFPARVRLALVELGTTFQKLGQTLATRPDLCGDALAEELGKLQAATTADPPSVVRARIQGELGSAPEALFCEFDDVPLATASIAQVHAARLHDGSEVVVKLVRSGVVDEARTDLDILAAVARLAEAHAPAMRAWRPTLVVRHFRRSLERELDFVRERTQLERFRSAFAGVAGVRFPAPVPALCSRGALTMERFRGTLFTDPRALRARGVDLSALARRGAQMWVDMVFRDGFFHADPHAGNLVLLPDGALGVLDCGMVGRVDAELRGRLEELLLHAVERRGEDIASCVARMCEGGDSTDLPSLRQDVEEILEDFVDVPIDSVDLGAMFASVFGALHRHQLALPPSLAMLLRTLAVLEGTSRMLDRSFSLAELLGPAYARSVRRRWSPSRVSARAVRAAREWEALASSFPSDFRRVLERMRDGAFRVRLEHRHLDDSVNRLTLGILVASLVLASAWLWTSAAQPGLAGAPTLGAIGFATASLLGWRLWRSSRRALRDRAD
jgi:ubiquinone biosynthesis protein